MANTKQRATDVDMRAAQAGSAYGNEVVHYGKLSAAAPDTCGILRALRIPGGTRIDELIIINDDFDSTTVPTITCKVGYTPVNSTLGPAADDDYFFAASSTLLQTAAKNTSTSKPIVFDYDVYIDVEVQVIAKSFAATAPELHVIARGELKGTK